MDAAEAAALAALSEKERFRADQLPSGIDADMLTCLGVDGMIEARLLSHRDPCAPKDFTMWFSPASDRCGSGGWRMLLMNPPNVEVRVTDRGRAALARLRRVVQGGEPGGSGGVAALWPAPIQAAIKRF